MWRGRLESNLNVDSGAADRQQSLASLRHVNTGDTRHNPRGAKRRNKDPGHCRCKSPVAAVQVALHDPRSPGLDTANPEAERKPKR
jgi:hypothetical protein